MQVAETEPATMTADEVAKLLGISRGQVYAGASRGEIPHRRVGRRCIFSRDAILAWLKTS